MTVPRHIFQTWETREVPSQWKTAHHTVLQHNPEFQYFLITDDDRYMILRRHFPSLVPIMKRYPYAIQRADLIRYVLLYLYGGVYLDLDYVCLRNLAPLLDSLPPGCAVGLVPSNNSRGHVTNSVLVSHPRAEFWLYVIRAAMQNKPWWAVTKHLLVFSTTGPFMLNRILGAYPRPWKIHIFRNVVVPCNTCNLTRCKATDLECFLLPVVGKSWHDWDSSMFDWMYCHSTLLLMAMVCFTICFMIHKSK